MSKIQSTLFAHLSWSPRLLKDALKIVFTMNETRQLSKLGRQELYDLIWSAPATKLAADFGISSVALAKRCKKQNMPTPSRGYWAKRS